MQTPAYPLQATPMVYTDALVPELPNDIKDVLRLTPTEATSCSVFALSSRYRQEDDETTTSRVAVCFPVPREHWYEIAHGQIILYTELYHFPEDKENPAGTTALVTHCGPLRIYDGERGLFYACSWDNGIDRECDFAADDIQEVWVVQRFIEARA